MDIVGVPNILAEAELLSAVCTFFESVGITSNDVGIKVNSRKVLGAVLKKAGVPEDSFQETCVIIDKKDKIGDAEVRKELVETIGLREETAFRITDAMSAKTIDEFAAKADVGNSEDVQELRRLFELAKDYGYADWLQFDASVVRGLAYYTGVVFEGFDKAGVLRAICGGGRYDKLLTLYGSDVEMPCVGFGFGDCVIAELLKEKGVTPSLPAQVDFVVSAFNPDFMGAALQVARILRRAGKSVDVHTDPSKKVGKAFNYADRVGAKYVAFVAPSEWESGCVRVKNLRDGEGSQKDVPVCELGRIDDYFTNTEGARSTNIPSVVQKVEQTNLECVLEDQPYLCGFKPSNLDREKYEHLSKTSGRPKEAASQRWYDHIESFSECERASWT